MNINMEATFHSFCFCHLGSCREVLTGSWFARNKITLRDFVLYVCNRHRWLHPWASENSTTKFSPLLWAVWELSRCGRCTAPSREPSAYHILRELRLLFFLDAVCSIYDYCSALTIDDNKYFQQSIMYVFTLRCATMTDLRALL